MDACEDAPMESPSTAAVAPSGSTPNNNETTSPLLTSVTAAPLPEWQSESFSPPKDPLAPNPLSEWRSPDVDIVSHLPPPPPDFPPEWTAIVASDVAQMTMEARNSSASIPAASANPASDSSMSEEAARIESSPSVRRFSDAYLAGMPSKRRKVNANYIFITCRKGSAPLKWQS